MSSLFAQSELKDLIEKVEKGERLDFNAGVRMLNSQDILALGYMANLVCERKNGNQTFFRVTRQINYSDLGTDLGDLTDLSEIHLMGDFNPELSFEYYVEMLQQVKRLLPKVCVQAFSALEVDYFARMADLPVTEILQRLMDVGLDSLSGSKAEVFTPQMGAKLGDMNVSAERYLEIQESAHRLGMRTNAAMFYGQVGSTEERIEHLLKLRELQDRTSGFLTFMPLAYYPNGIKEEMMGVSNSTGFEDLKILSTSRILLDNFEHIKADWVVLGPKLAQVSLTFGVDALDSHLMSKRALIHLIEKARREAVEQSGKETSACKE
ncbi:aminofutalosine synthase MqnE [Desulfosporosinus burensis]